MSRMIFVNLPVADLAKATTFYEAIGLARNPQFSDDTASCMVLSDDDQRHADHARQMAHVHEPPDRLPATSSEVMLAISCDSREAVDAMSDGRRRRRRNRRYQPRPGLSASCTTGISRTRTATSGKRSG